MNTGVQEEPGTKRKYVRKQMKRGMIVKLLRETSDTFRMKDPKMHEVYFKNPFYVYLDFLSEV